MKTSVFASLISVSFLFLACSNGQKESLDGELSSALSSEKRDTEQFNGKLDQLLTLEMAARCANQKASEAEVKYNKVLKTPEYHSLDYFWPSDRIRKMDISGMQLEVPRPNTVGISFVKATDLETFSFDYHNPTKEEWERAKKVMKSKESELVKDGNVTEEQAGEADDMANSLMQDYEVIDIPGLGDKAVWVKRKHESSLKVLYHGIEFSLNVDLSDNESENKKQAIKLAKEVVKNI